MAIVIKASGVDNSGNAQDNSCCGMRWGAIEQISIAQQLYNS
jgi:hypothetical protein